MSQGEHAHDLTGAYTPYATTEVVAVASSVHLGLI